MLIFNKNTQYVRKHKDSLYLKNIYFSDFRK